MKAALATAVEEKEAARVAAEVKACERVAAVLEQTNFEREQNDEVLGGRYAACSLYPALHKWVCARGRC